MQAIEREMAPRFAKHSMRVYQDPALFKRDAHTCLYCGHPFQARDLSRDHVRPLSTGGSDAWANVVTACKRCNNHKAGQTPEEAGMTLLAVPFTPTHAEYVYLQGKRVPVAPGTSIVNVSPSVIGFAMPLDEMPLPAPSFATFCAMSTVTRPAAAGTRSKV